MARRQYTEDDKAVALAALQANGGNVLRTARDLDIPQSTLRKWRDGEGINPAVALKCDQKKEELDGLFEQAVRVYLGHALDEAVVGKTSGKDAVIAAATATDKMRLLRDQSTSISGHELTNDERLARLRELASLAYSRRPVPPDGRGESGMGQPGQANGTLGARPGQQAPANGV